jgi:hypothetical protein
MKKDVSHPDAEFPIVLKYGEDSIPNAKQMNLRRRAEKQSEAHGPPPGPAAANKLESMEDWKVRLKHIEDVQAQQAQIRPFVEGESLGPLAIECTTPGCHFNGRPESNGQCSKCFMSNHEDPNPYFNIGDLRMTPKGVITGVSLMDGMVTQDTLDAMIILLRTVAPEDMHICETDHGTA